MIGQPADRIARLAWLKRLIDVTGALVDLVLTMPLMALIAIAIKLDSPGPVLFVQARGAGRQTISNVQASIDGRRRGDAAE